MRIIGSTIELASTHRFEAERSVSERLRVRVRPAEGEDSFRPGDGPTDREAAKLTRLLRRYFERAERGEDTAKLSARIDALVKRIEDRSGDDQTVQVDFRYRRRESYREVEATSFRAAGSVTTADGRQIDFSQALDLARAYARTETIKLAGSAVVKLGAPASDAPAEEPAAVQQGLALGGGVLGLDANHDGSIDPATEVVGRSGNGFEELRQYDEDGNGFIDEGDSIFGSLAVAKASSGEGVESASLAERGIGAIYLGSVATPFTVRDASGAVTGQLSRSGVYLNEDGTTGIAQQIGS